MTIKTILTLSAGALILATGVAAAQIKIDPRQSKVPPEITERLQDIASPATSPGLAAKAQKAG